MKRRAAYMAACSQRVVASAVTRLASVASTSSAAASRLLVVLPCLPLTIYVLCVLYS
ncbi:hypothetical protein Syun_011207 [Stephania yunnanensis]|uniref:Uncharacterized protein n=1 Tax=Stephania yunnanensis TaxID=152371 RepID=A0AAP0JX39_9MAGN